MCQIVSVADKTAEFIRIHPSDITKIMFSPFLPCSKHDDLYVQFQKSMDRSGNQFYPLLLNQSPHQSDERSFCSLRYVKRLLKCTFTKPFTPHIITIKGMRN